MEKSGFVYNDELVYPHSADVLERKKIDNRFSDGWGMHFTPVEKYWTDVHTHMEIADSAESLGMIRQFLHEVSNLNVKYIIAITPGLVNDDKYIKRSEDFDYFKKQLEGFPNIKFMLYLRHDDPDCEKVKNLSNKGIGGIKLHNAPIITEALNPELWLSDKWSEIFEAIEEKQLPILWHVTQRLSDSPYTGGGRNTYWKDGWKKGVKYTNEDLLQIFLNVVERYPGIKFVGAHQLHIGWTRLVELFEKYPNLYIDTTIGCMLRRDFEIYDYDRNFLRKIFVKYCDRILFGTDLTITSKNLKNTTNIIKNYENHMRFIRSLRLPDNALQLISHGNAEMFFEV